MKKFETVRDILYSFIIEDDKKRHKVSYNLSKNIDKVEKRILNLKLKQFTEKKGVTNGI